METPVIVGIVIAALVVILFIMGYVKAPPEMM